MYNTYYLMPKYDSRASFYNKAMVIENNGVKTLYSYLVPVCQVKEDGCFVLGAKWDSSSTTLRHVKEFMKQHGCKVDCKKDIEKYIECNSKAYDESMS